MPSLWKKYMPKHFASAVRSRSIGAPTKLAHPREIGTLPLGHRKWNQLSERDTGTVWTRLKLAASE